MNLTIRISEFDVWSVLSIKGRVDAFTDKKIIKEINDLKEKGNKNLALDLSQTDFVSIQAMRFFITVAIELRACGGDLIFLSPAPIVKRHIDIFIGSENFQIYKNLEDLQLKTIYFKDWSVLNTQ